MRCHQREASDTLDVVTVTRKRKLKLHHLGECPRLSWDLTITEFSVFRLEETLDSMVTRYLNSGTLRTGYRPIIKTRT